MSFPGSGRRQRRATSPRFRFFSGAGAFCFVFSSVLFFVVCRPGCVFSCFPVIFFACVYVFVFQGCAVREAGVLCGSGIKSLKKVMEKFGCLVWRLYFCTRFRERNAAARRSPGAGVQ